MAALPGYEVLLDASTIVGDTAAARTVWVRIQFPAEGAGSDSVSAIRDTVAHRWEAYRSKGLTHEQAVSATLVDLLTVRAARPMDQRSSLSSPRLRVYDVQVNVDCRTRDAAIKAWRFSAAADLPSEVSPAGPSSPVPVAPESVMEAVLNTACASP